MFVRRCCSLLFSVALCGCGFFLFLAGGVAFIATTEALVGPVPEMSSGESPNYVATHPIAATWTAGVVFLESSKRRWCRGYSGVEHLKAAAGLFWNLGGGGSSARHPMGTMFIFSQLTMIMIDASRKPEPGWQMILVNSRFTASTFAKTFKHLHARGIRPDVLYPAVNVNQFDEPRSFKVDIAGGYDKRLRENVEYLKELKSLAERKGVADRINFVTSCSTTERNSLLSQCLCVLYTPTDEHFGIVPLEAMAAHKPIIACNSGGPVETIKNGETGLALSNNNLTGPIPDPISELVNLALLDLSSNNLSGNFELHKLSSASNANYCLPDLSTLNLSSCNTSEFPNFVRNLPRLVTLDLSHNKIRFIEANMFVNLTNLQELDLSHKGPLSFSNINNVTRLARSYDIAHAEVLNKNTTWGSNLQALDLSNNLLTTVEYYPWKNVETLNLGSNLLEGQLLVPPLSTKVFLISNNRLTGAIPSSMCNIGFDSNTFDLSNNNLSGAIPTCMAYAKLRHLYLHMNHFHGVIPDFYVEDYMLNRLNLNDNDFEGPVPKSLVNCQHLEVLNLGNNKINGTFPHWLGILPRLQVLALRSNHFHGRKALQKMDRISGVCEY
ncbi:putative beta-1,3-galactosyltransferase 14-like [Hibiscus syriacus]|uniref:Beta-1,3-galactosyltransferase 14-like n=1 Tax=Hibiscus syriacus TaxID=106335 RepID=A0A6A3BBL9_HIBSY|nr:putative beta-1,3-galactosyltransferase 14-like [Hibiscus syriacus]